MVAGVVGGLLGTAVMTGLMMVMGDGSPPPTAALWSKYVGDGPTESYRMQGMVLHFLYGTVAGVVFVLVAPAVSSVSTLVGGLVAGLVYGVVLFVVAAVFWMRIVLGIDAETRQTIGFLGSHLAYGGVLGAVVGLGVV